MVRDVYFLTVHEPYDEPGAPAPVNALIVAAATFLHPDLPQPDAARIYRCLTELPGRVPGCLVPLSALNRALDDGRLWPQVADWRAVVRALIALSRTPGRCESMPLALPAADAELLAAAPGQPVHVITAVGVTVLGEPDRRELLAELASGLPEVTGEPPLWPGDGLVQPPAEPAVMPCGPRSA
jgi:hypothetical protein